MDLWILELIFFLFILSNLVHFPLTVNEWILIISAIFATTHHLQYKHEKIID